MKTVSAAEANRHFSKILRDVRAGETVIVTSRGEPVVEIQPPSRMLPSRRRRSRTTREKPDRAEALRRLLARLDAQPALNLPRIRRDELYDD